MIIKLLQKEMLKRKKKTFVCFFLAATVASQWLDFLHQDLSGRLAGVWFYSDGLLWLIEF